jgi:hypothetical protein
MGLIITGILTAHSFDVDVWNRDIDSSPSPFPVRIIFAYVFPCYTIPEADGDEEDDDDDEGRLYHASGERSCFPGCNGCQCSPRKVAPEMMVQNGTRGSLTGSSIGGSLSASLVRIPNEFERRSSIMIAFEV